MLLKHFQLGMMRIEDEGTEGKKKLRENVEKVNDNSREASIHRQMRS